MPWAAASSNSEAQLNHADPRFLLLHREKRIKQNNYKKRERDEGSKDSVLHSASSTISHHQHASVLLRFQPPAFDFPQNQIQTNKRKSQKKRGIFTYRRVVRCIIESKEIKIVEIDSPKFLKNRECLQRELKGLLLD
ncbi:unnamed protein product [Vicia faba]|uniref:Uncharacterized protein n=1 Tax=Vicia faba TaxID=3906 RepID=A0AAV0Z8F3_VICFA|nr:unnamed protein product [Vicia faba]